MTSHLIVNIYAFGITPTETINLLAGIILINKQYFFPSYVSLTSLVVTTRCTVPKSSGKPEIT